MKPEAAKTGPTAPAAPYDPGRDGLASWRFGIACRREMAVRSGCARPVPGRDHEARWASEGPVPVTMLETALIADVEEGTA